MSCSCRTGPLRTFVSGLAQVHKLEAPSSNATRSWRRGASSITPVITLSQLRNLHSSPRRLQEAAAAVEAPKRMVFVMPSDVSEGPAITKQHSANRAKGAEKKIVKAQNLDTVEAKMRGKRTKLDGAPKKRGRPAKSAKSALDDGLDWKKKGRATASSSRPAERKSKRVPLAEDSSKGRNIKYNPITASMIRTEAPEEKVEVPNWKIQKEALGGKFPDGWRPIKRLSPDALAGIRALNTQFPDVYTTEALAERFEMSPENIRRILKGTWKPTTEEEEDRMDRWHRRGISVWERKAAMGMKPPRKWREEGVVRDASFHIRREDRIKHEENWEEEEKRMYREYRATLHSGASRVLQ